MKERNKELCLTCGHLKIPVKTERGEFCRFCGHPFKICEDEA